MRRGEAKDVPDRTPAKLLSVRHWIVVVSAIPPTAIMHPHSLITIACAVGILPADAGLDANVHVDIDVNLSSIL